MKRQKYKRCGECINMEYQDMCGYGWCEAANTEVYCEDFCKLKKQEIIWK